MARLRRPCLEEGCRELTFESRCPEHTRARQRARDARRGTPAERGYDSEYRRNREAVLAKSRAADTLAPVEGESCGGCFQTLTPQVQDLLRRDKPVFCKSCGRLLYLPE